MCGRFVGFVAFLIYMITIFTLYVPDWSFVDHANGDEPKRYTVHSLSISLISKFLLDAFIFHILFFLPFNRSYVEREDT
jgi:hypothetical protein